MKTLITTVPFGQLNSKPLELLRNNKINFTINPLGKKLSESDLVSIIDDYEILIAGTEPITSKVINTARKLKFISRVGIGLDNIDLQQCKMNNIEVSYTPNAPAPAVAELTIANILSTLRSTHISNLNLHNKKWQRYFGRDLNDTKVGVIGMGRIGTIVVDLLLSLGVNDILVNDIKQNNLLQKKYKNKILWTSKEYIYQNSDLISLHIPLTDLTNNLINLDIIKTMKKNVILINTSRGGIINEDDLFYALSNKLILSAAVDVFKKEPYSGNLSLLDNCLLTSHMGSMSTTCRSNMEIEATEEALRFIKNKPLKQLVPQYEYDTNTITK